MMSCDEPDARKLTRVLSALVVCAVLSTALAGGLLADGRQVRSAWPRPGDYFGFPPPGETPVLFAPGVISTGLSERDVAMTPDGGEFYFGVLSRALTTILVSRKVNGQWTEPEVASFASDPRYYYLEPTLAADGRRILFLTTRPRAGEPARPGWANQSIWAADRQPNGEWGEPYDIGEPINGGGGTYFPSLTRDGTLYFIRTAAPGKDAVVYRSRFVNGRYAEPERLPDTVNGTGVTFNAFIAPDERYLIAGVDGRDDSTPPKRPNYYVFFRNPDGSWTPGVNMGPAINDPANTSQSPYVTPDGRYFFFSSSIPRPASRTTLKGLTWGQIVESGQGAQNGNLDIYWVSASVIEKLRPRS